MIILDITKRPVVMNLEPQQLLKTVSKNGYPPYADVTVSMFRTIMYISRKNI